MINRPVQAWRHVSAIAFGLLAVAGASSASFAADMSVEALDWSGLYAGGSLGLSKGDTSLDVSTQHTNNYFSGTDHNQIQSAGTQSFKPTDLNGNVFVGRNWQQGNWVYGVQADLSLTNFDEEHKNPYTSFISAPAQSFRMDTSVISYWNAKFQPRLGYAKDRSLYYVSAGPALTQVQYDFTYQDKAANNEFSHISTNKLALGWTAGLGLEHKLQDGWSLKSEFSYTYFNNAVEATSSLKNYADGFNHGLDFGIANLQFGVVKRF